MKGKKLIVAGLLLAFILAVLAVPEVYAKNYNPGVLPPHSKVLGKTYGEWGDIWWNWAVVRPTATNPMYDQTGENCDAEQSGHIWFLAGVGDPGGSATRACTVPPGKFIFFPLVNTFFAAEEGGGERDKANKSINKVSILECSIDGVPLQNLSSSRAQSPDGGFVLTVPPDSLYTEIGAPAGDYAPAVSDGYWIMLAPLPIGNYTIKFRGVVAGDPGQADFETDVVYHLTIVPPGKGK